MFAVMQDETGGHPVRSAKPRDLHEALTMQISVMALYRRVETVKMLSPALRVIC
jgi:hypothetical protein